MPIGFSNEQLSQSAAGPLPAEVRAVFLTAAATAFLLAGPAPHTLAEVTRPAESERRRG
jgi:hypothetical protein